MGEVLHVRSSVVHPVFIEWLFIDIVLILGRHMFWPALLERAKGRFALRSRKSQVVGEGLLVRRMLASPWLSADVVGITEPSHTGVAARQGCTAACPTGVQQRI